MSSWPYMNESIKFVLTWPLSLLWDDNILVLTCLLALLLVNNACDVNLFGMIMWWYREEHPFDCRRGARNNGTGAWNAMVVEQEDSNTQTLTVHESIDACAAIGFLECRLWLVRFPIVLFQGCECLLYQIPLLQLSDTYYKYTTAGLTHFCTTKLRTLVMMRKLKS